MRRSALEPAAMKRAKGKGQRAEGKAQPERKTQSAKRKGLRGRVLLVGTAVLSIAAAGAFLYFNREPGALDISTDPFPAPKQIAATPVASSEFVGSERCAECHRAQVEAWRGSTHARAGGTPGATRALESATSPAASTPIQTLFQIQERTGMSGRSRSFSSPGTGEGSPQ